MPAAGGLQVQDGLRVRDARFQIRAFFGGCLRPVDPWRLNRLSPVRNLRKPLEIPGRYIAVSFPEFRVTIGKNSRTRHNALHGQSPARTQSSVFSAVLVNVDIAF